MIEIIPAILVPTFEQLESTLTRLKGIARAVQVDVVDGSYAPNITWPYKDEASFRLIVVGDEGMPLWEDFDFEFDLMVEGVDKVVPDFVAAGASKIIVHLNSQGANEAIEVLQSSRTGDFPIAVGVALGSTQKAEELAAVEGLFDYVQMMGIEKVGFQGQPFDERSLSLISAVRAKYPELPVQVDGAVTLDTAPRLVEAGATRLCVGSAVTLAEDPQAAYRALYNKVNAN